MLVIKVCDSWEVYEKRKEGEEMKDELELDDGWVVLFFGDLEREVFVLKFFEYVFELELYDYWLSYVRRMIVCNINFYVVVEDVSC